MAEIYDQDICLYNDIKVADSFMKRLLGLLGSKYLNDNQGLILENCKQVHMFGMKYPIDVIFLSSDGQVLSYEECLQPGKVSAYVKEAKWVLEVQAGSFKKFQKNQSQKLKLKV
ncbi:MAG: uncharacterized protein PWP16_1014 [Eubacteriaceae bacterium]|jgi:uncharacterized membrane protein (UPF0127 family)|nr:uncharacterized protein [Eubacteriaceae bacterium]MDK2904013.1 uncharacterized protein [Eubacteriaceae bacterium]MDK2936599.1 uncharacterized protein [Eubacteriaceae bacterium]MDK2961059.1 uncharacterized protein [Eubacteriaceae bacterium]MDN5307651.1 uncharacterized protein [Eubacteriaceae bacterium]